MRRHSKLAAITASKSGASLLFVLGTMLLLMAVGTSALAAASAAAGAGINKQTANQLNLYAESIHKSIMYSLQASKKLDGGKDVLSNSPDASVVPETLGGQILAAAYKEARDAFEAESGYASLTRYEYSGELAVDVTPKLKDDTDTSERLEEAYKQVTLAVASEVRIDKEREEEYFVFAGSDVVTMTEQIPRTATVGARVTVIVTVEHQGKSLTSAATYRCMGGELTGDASKMLIDHVDALKWEFVSYEKYDH